MVRMSYVWMDIYLMVSLKIVRWCGMRKEQADLESVVCLSGWNGLGWRLLPLFEFKGKEVFVFLIP